MSRLSLSQRLSLVFAGLLVACFAASTWLQGRSIQRHEQEAIQRLSGGLAAHIAGSAELMNPAGVNPAAVKALFGQLMAVNPSVEVYLLDPAGTILAHDAPDGHVRRRQVDLGPVQALLAGSPLPIVGDDPRGDGRRQVFNAAPILLGGRLVGYVYVVLIGEDHAAVMRQTSGTALWRTTLGAMGLVTALALVAGLLAFRWITRPLRTLRQDIDRVRAQAAGHAPDALSPGDEIAALRLAFDQMTARIADQWRELAAQDQQRREFVANISHDLRTPLTSLHGYLETLQLKAETLTLEERRRYLGVALDQSRKVGGLAQALFELARLEYGVVKPDREPFSLADLVQDVFQKFELAAESRQLQLAADIGEHLPTVDADFGMIERVLTNLLDNAIRHTPQGGRIEVRLRRDGAGVGVQVSDTGPGIPEALRGHLFTRPAFHSGAREFARGLGLMIVYRILQLHDADIRLVARAGRGAVFEFELASPRSLEN